ncbi:MAG: class I SAM-dependent methyltransferase [Candidatus Methanoperedens sp.]|nr:class I SAM-dependent methyltransferase [Candidatus Methanoperedens sp.]
MGYFDHFAKSKSTRFGQILDDYTIEKEFRIITRFMYNPEVEILEIGPGKGGLAKKFIEMGYQNYDVVELNVLMRNNIARVVRKTKNYEIPELKEKDNSYDAIICCDVFEHLNDTKEAKLFISEVHRVLRNEGLIIIVSPDYLDWKRDFFNCDFSHSNITSVRRTIQLFYNNNIATIYYNYFYSYFEGIVGKILNATVKIITFFIKGNSLDSKLYKLRLTFLRRFIIVGRKLQ